jgi:glutathione S-transferase
MQLTLIYAKFPFWRAEICRLALHLGGVPFEEQHPARGTLPDLERDGTLPYGQIPVLLVDGEPLAQTGAIARFCADLAGMTPRDPFTAAKVDELIDATTDITNLLSPTMRISDLAERLKAREALVAGPLAQWLGRLDRAAGRAFERSGQGPWLFGEQLTIADLALWGILKWLKSGSLDGVPATIVDPYPHLTTVFERVSAHEGVSAWMTRYAS